MSGDNIQPEEGGEVTVINPSEGNAVPEVQPDEGDALDAAELEAVKAYTSTDDEATEEEIVPEEVVADPPPEPDQAAEEAKVEVVPEESPKSAWDGNPDNLPNELQDTYKTMLRGFHSKTKELAEAKKDTEKLQAELLLRVTDGKTAEAKPEAPPPLPTGDNITQEAWNDAVTKQNAWYAEQNRTAMLAEMEKSNKFVSADEFAQQQRQADNSNFFVIINSNRNRNITFSHEITAVAKVSENPFYLGFRLFLPC